MNSEQLETLIERDQKQEIFDLLSKNPELAEKETSLGISPVLLACYYKKTAIANIIAQFSKSLTLFDWCAIGNFDQAHHFLQLNPDNVNSFSKDGFTPLGLAAYFGHENLCRLLISKGAEVNVPANNGFNVYPIHSAVSARSYGITEMLLEAGAEVNVKQQAGFTALHAAAQLGEIEIIILLLEHGAELNTRMEGGKLPADLAEEKGFTEIAAILQL